MNELCVHHWLVATPEGPVVGARCKRCGAVRQFSAAGDFEAGDFTVKAQNDWLRRPAR